MVPTIHFLAAAEDPAGIRGGGDDVSVPTYIFTSSEAVKRKTVIQQGRKQVCTIDIGHSCKYVCQSLYFCIIEDMISMTVLNGCHMTLH